MVLRAGCAGLTMSATGCVIRLVGSAAELAGVFDVMGAQFQPARTPCPPELCGAGPPVPAASRLMLVAADDG